jgi:phage-related protein
MSSYMNLGGDRSNTNNHRVPLSPRYNAENNGGSLARFGDIYSNNGGKGINTTTNTSSGVRIQTVSQMSDSLHAGSTVQIQNMLVKVGDR